MNKIMKLNFILAAFFLLGFLTTQAQVSNFTVRPFLFNENLQPRDVVTREVALTNDTSRKLNIYATVNEITLDTTGEIKEFISPVMTDRSLNATSWVEITRGRITLDPGESTTTPITFHVHSGAKPGDYNVFVGFVDTNKRFIAEETALRGDARGIPVQITIGENLNTALAITKFKVPRFIFKESRRDIDFRIANNGEVSEVPKGEIIFYNSRGEEVSSSLVNTEAEPVTPGEEMSYPNRVPIYETIGRFTASVNINYGKNGQLSLYESTEFFIIPWYWLLILVLLIIIFSLFVTYLIKRAMEDHMVVEQEEVDLPLTNNSGYRSEKKDHDITLSKD